MSHPNLLKPLVALLLAGAALVGCGGGDAEPPPPPVGNPQPGATADTTAPTVAIANNVSTPTATGPVTFSFVFSEDVGTSFDGTDIVVTGGSAGTFTRVDGRQATLVVTPTPNVAGTMTVSVAAGRFNDIAGNANTAAANGSKDYVAPPPPPPPPTTGLVLANFDSISPPIAGFEGGEGSAVEAGPVGGSGNALKVLRSGGQVFALAIVTLPNNVPLEAGRKTISARVYSPTAGVPMVLKLEGPGGNPSSGDVQANETVVVGWQTLTWTINAVNTNYNVIVLLPNLGTVDAPPGKAYFFDDIQLLGVSSGGGSGTVLANFDSISPPIAGFEGGEGSAVEAGPVGGSGNALKVLRSGGQVFALAIVTLPSNVPLAAGRLTISARVHSPTAGIPMVLKLEGPGGNPSSGDLQANEAVVVGWQTLTWTVPAVNTNYNVIVLLPNLGTVDAPPGKAYYFDDITLVGAGSGGGGGSTGPQTFSSGFAAGNRTIQGGEFGGFSGSNQDNFACTGDPARCGSGGDFNPAVAAADSFFFYYYQTPTPATDLYMGIFVLAPGVTGGLSNTTDNTGIQINGQTSMKFTLGQNPEWFGTATNKFAVDLTLGKRYVVGGNTCRVQLRRIVTPTAAAASAYTVTLAGFTVVQDCAQSGITVASALAASPISQVSFQGVGGGIALSAGGQTSGANLSVPVNGVYPTTLVVKGGITFE